MITEPPKLRLSPYHGYDDNTGVFPSSDLLASYLVENAIMYFLAPTKNSRLPNHRMILMSVNITALMKQIGFELGVE